MNTATDQQYNTIEDVEAFLEEHEPRILSTEEMAQLQVALWKLRDGAGNARLCRDIAVWMNALLGITEAAFERALELKAGAA